MSRRKDARNGIRRDMYFSRCPWARYLYYARTRCRNEKADSYSYYGGRGIRVRLTVDETGTIWKRDNASKMARPSLDRIDSDGDYSLENCRFIELSENSSGRRNRLYAVDDWRTRKKNRG